MSHWQKYHARWAQIQPPLRPDQDVVRALKTLTASPSGPVLLLGVTPELADAFDHVHAIDKNPAMIENVWPGDTDVKKAWQGDWLQAPLPSRHFHAVLGDGSLNNVSYPGELKLLLQRARDCLVPHGTFACRLFERPATPYSIADLQQAASGNASINFHAFKWKMAMHIAEKNQAMVPVAAILRLFEELFPDRDQLAHVSGWPRSAIETIDVYRGSPVEYSFPDRREFLDALPDGIRDTNFMACGHYDLAENCPILSFRKN